MNIDAMMQQTGAVEAIARELGVDRATAEAGAAALLPAILSGLQNPVAAGGAPAGGSAFPDLGSLGGLLGTISGLGGGGLLDNVVSTEPTEVGQGNQILGEIFGSKDGSRAVAASAAAQSGLQPSLLKRMLPIVAMVAAGYVMRQATRPGNRESVPAGGATPANPLDGLTRTQGSGDILGSLIAAAGRYLQR